MSARLFDNLKQLGFNEYEARVYVEMLHQIDPLTAYEIGKLSGVPRSKVYEVVDNLRRKQFVVQIEDNPKKYLPVDPEEVFSSIEKSFRTSVNFVKEELNHLERGETIDYIFNIFGKETIIERSKQMIRSASSSILIAVDRLMLDVLYKELESAEHSGIELSIVLYGKRERISTFRTYTATSSGSPISGTSALSFWTSISRRFLQEHCLLPPPKVMDSGPEACI